LPAYTPVEAPLSRAKRPPPGRLTERHLALFSGRLRSTQCRRLRRVPEAADKQLQKENIMNVKTNVKVGKKVPVPGTPGQTRF
jgi:hypothetical protein